MKNYYKILQVDPDVDPIIIKKAFNGLMKELKKHPDLGGDTEEAKEINEAYAVLSDSVKRKEYDIKFKEKWNKRESNTDFDTHEKNKYYYEDVASSNINNFDKGFSEEHILKLLTLINEKNYPSFFSGVKERFRRIFKENHEVDEEIKNLLYEYYYPLEAKSFFTFWKEHGFLEAFNKVSEQNYIIKEKKDTIKCEISSRFRRILSKRKKVNFDNLIQTLQNHDVDFLFHHLFEELFSRSIHIIDNFIMGLGHNHSQLLIDYQEKLSEIYLETKSEINQRIINQKKEVRELELFGQEYAKRQSMLASREISKLSTIEKGVKTAVSKLVTNPLDYQAILDLYKYTITSGLYTTLGSDFDDYKMMVNITNKKITRLLEENGVSITGKNLAVLIHIRSNQLEAEELKV